MGRKRFFREMVGQVELASLPNSYPRIYNNSMQQNYLVADMVAGGIYDRGTGPGGGVGSAGNWRC